MQQYIADFMNDPLLTAPYDTMHSCEHHLHSHAEETAIMQGLIRDVAGQEFIEAHMDDYMSLYFSPPPAALSTLPDICANGGFEAGFDYYSGFISTYRRGSDSCRPVLRPSATGFIPVPLPTPRRFEIVSSGMDSLIGTPRALFGQHAVRINSRYGHDLECQGSLGVDKLVKKFTVTPETRSITVWYAIALENPAGHNNTQPFFNIRCDRAPESELCFDADIIPCNDRYADPRCRFDSIDAFDWACHRINIPAQFIDSVAILEITVGDCGLGAHFGYAYVDGICEPCDERSVFGSVSVEDDFVFSYCNEALVTICGTYSDPIICGSWQADTVFVPGHDIENVEIDTVEKTFCFDFPRSNLGGAECLDIYAELIFASEAGDRFPGQFSNAVTICDDQFNMEALDVSGIYCIDPNTMDILSDDHYYVYLTVDDTDGGPWTLSRYQLYPLPNDDVAYTLAEGVGDTFIRLGPFFIQEGIWFLRLQTGECLREQKIIPPDYCSGCNSFNRLITKDYECDDGGTPDDASDDTWSFAISVKGARGVPHTETYTIEASPGVAPPGNINWGAWNTIHGMKIEDGCVKLELSHQAGDCDKSMYFCPPSSCIPDDGCDLRVYPGAYLCGVFDKNYLLSLNIDFDSTLLEEGYVLCFEGVSARTGEVVIEGSQEDLDRGYLGPIEEDIYLTVTLCEGETCEKASCKEQGCAQTIYLPYLEECQNYEPPYAGEHRQAATNKPLTIANEDAVIVIPNPVVDDVLRLECGLPHGTARIMDLSGVLLYEGELVKGMNRIDFRQPAGVYLLTYQIGEDHPHVKRFVKF